MKIIVTIKRGLPSTVVAQHIPGQIDLMTDENAVDHGEVAADYYRFSSNLGYVPDLRQGDVMTDEINIDPLTSTFYQYRVRGQINLFPFHHIEAKIEHKQVK